MLAFTRRPNESFFIGEDIVVKMLGRDKQGNIKIGLEVPESVSVRGEEIINKPDSSASDK